MIEVVLTERAKRNFIKKVRIPADVEECWEWTGGKNTEGYGQFGIRRKMTSAHRVALVVDGQKLIPEFHVHHKCYNHSCVNPLHLEQVTPRDNTCDSKSSSFPAINAAKTHCKYGHELTFVKSKRVHGRRSCKICSRAAVRRSKLKKTSMVKLLTANA